MNIALVFAINTMFYPDRADHERSRRCAHIRVYSALGCLIRPSEESANNLDGVLIACLLILARQVTSVGLANCPCPDIAMGLAVFVGLHLDPDYFPALSAVQAQMRRRLWYNALGLTFQALSNLSIPRTISMEQCDTKLPQNIDDENFMPETADFQEGCQTIK